MLKKAQTEALDLTNWHQFLSALVDAGYRGKEMISSKTALIYAYVFYLMGRKRYGVTEALLQKAIGRWFFASSLLGRYTSSQESQMEAALNNLIDSGDFLMPFEIVSYSIDLVPFALPSETSLAD